MGVGVLFGESTNERGQRHLNRLLEVEKGFRKVFGSAREVEGRWVVVYNCLDWVFRHLLQLSHLTLLLYSSQREGERRQ